MGNVTTREITIYGVLTFLKKVRYRSRAITVAGNAGGHFFDVAEIRLAARARFPEMKSAMGFS
jgi:hypothetical protein